MFANVSKMNANCVKWPIFVTFQKFMQIYLEKRFLDEKIFCAY